MSRRSNPGLKALFDISGIRETPDEQNIGFIVGPRINAAGRLGDSKLGVEILCANDEAQATLLASKLNELNDKRKSIQNNVLEGAIDKVERDELNKNNVIIISDPNWHEGVIGIIAGRIKDLYHKPTIVISINQKCIGKGSCRSVSGFDIGSAIIAAQQKSIILSGGGHEMAAGLNVEEKKIPLLYDFMNSKFEISSQSTKRLKDYNIEIVINVSAASKNLINEIKKLAPFGSHNLEPLISIPNVRLKSYRSIGQDGKHYAFNVSDGGSEKVDCITFNAAGTALGDAINLASNGPLMHIIGYLRENTYNGRPQLHVIDCFLLN